MPAKVDLTGQRFGRLLVVGETIERDFSFVIWACRCDCGAFIPVTSNKLRKGETQSCGCLRSDLRAENNLTHGGACGKRKERLYRIWKHMRQRCSNPSLPFAHRYVERGIRVCRSWQDYGVFRSWALTNGYADNLSLDRVDVDGDYEPGNCRWADAKTQGNNTSRNPWVKFNGERVQLNELLARHGVDRRAYRRRRSNGWSVERAMTTPKRTQTA